MATSASRADDTPNTKKSCSIDREMTKGDISCVQSKRM